MAFFLKVIDEFGEGEKAAPRCTDWSRVFIRSRAPYSIYTEYGTLIQSRALGVGHPAI